MATDLQPEETKSLIRAKLAQWRGDVSLFAREVFKFKASSQQERLFQELTALVSAKSRVDMGQPLTDAEKVYVSKRGISVRSGKGTGKDACAAIIVFWYLACFIGSKTYLIAPSMENLKSNLIAEMAKWKSRRVNGEPTCLLADEVEMLAAGCRIKSDPEGGKDWFVRSNSAGPHAPVSEQLEVLQGKHGRFTMFIIDEASGVPDPVFEPLDTTLTDPVNFILLFFNPTRRTGFAIDTHFGQEKKYWIPLHWNAEESDLITPSQIQYMRDKYGVESVEYRVSVLGEPPDADADSLIPYEWCVNARDLDVELVKTDPIVFGVDVARHGEDSSVILVRQGALILEITELQKLDTVEVSRWVCMRAADWNPQTIYIDAAGIGVGVFDECRRQGLPGIYAVNVGNSPKNTKKFNRLRDELWWEARTRFEQNRLSLYRCKDAQLISELSGIKFAVLDNGKIKVESKLDMRTRGMPSPNKADALILTFMAPDSSMELSRREQLRESEERVRISGGSNRTKYGWMGV